MQTADRFRQLAVEVCAASAYAKPFAARVVRCTQPLPSADMASVAELEAHLRANRSTSQELAKKIRKAQQAMVAGQKAATPRMRSVASITLAMAGGDFAAPMTYLQQRGRPACVSEIESWLAALSPLERAGLADQPDASLPSFRLWAEARRFTREAELVSWIKRQNKSKSVAPSPGAVLKQAAFSQPALTKKNSRYTWLRRLMCRSGGRKGRFACGPRLAPQAFEAKVLGDRTG
jgi:hypothetical protein